MNKRKLACDKKEVFAVGSEGSISDLKEKIKVCFDCYNFVSCTHASKMLNDIIRQQENIRVITRLI